MPLEDLGSYVPVMNAFGVHWVDVNAALGGTSATDLKLQDGFTLAMFLLLGDEVEATIAEMEGWDNARQIAANQRDTLKTALRERLRQFRGMLRVLLSKSKYATAPPVLPDPNLGESRFMAPFDDAADLWGRIDVDTSILGFTPPLVIIGYTRATFVADIAALRAAFLAVITAENDKLLGIRERDVLLASAREYMVQYRVGVEALFGPTHPLTLSLPVLSAAPGSTPAPVVLSGILNPTTNQAEFTWTPSDNPNLEEYEMQMSDGATFDAATATVIGNFPPGTTTFVTSTGVENPGNQASYKLFVRLTTGNVAGSNTVTIIRP